MNAYSVHLRGCTGSTAASPCDKYQNRMCRGGSRISGKGVHMYKGVGFVLLILSLSLKYPVKMKLFGLSETKLFQFHRIF